MLISILMALGCATEQPVNTRKAATARHKDPLPDFEMGLGAGGNDAADAFIAGDKRVRQAREGRHTTIPQQPLSACADTGPVDLNHAICTVGFGQFHGAQAHFPGLLENHRSGHCSHGDALTQLQATGHRFGASGWYYYTTVILN